MSFFEPRRRSRDRRDPKRATNKNQAHSEEASSTVSADRETVEPSCCARRKRDQDPTPDYKHIPSLHWYSLPQRYDSTPRGTVIYPRLRAKHGLCTAVRIKFRGRGQFVGYRLYWYMVHTTTYRPETRAAGRSNSTTDKLCCRRHAIPTPLASRYLPQPLIRSTMSRFSKQPVVSTPSLFVIARSSLTDMLSRGVTAGSARAGAGAAGAGAGAAGAGGGGGCGDAAASSACEAPLLLPSFRRPPGHHHPAVRPVRLADDRLPASRSPPSAAASAPAPPSPGSPVSATVSCPCARPPPPAPPPPPSRRAEGGA